MSGYVTHLEGAIDGAKLDPSQPHQLHQGRPILVRYDLDRIAPRYKPVDLLPRDKSLWRYRELLPVENPRPTWSRSAKARRRCFAPDRLGGLLEPRITSW